MLLVIVIRRRRMRKLQESCPIPYFIELGPPVTSGDKADHQLVHEDVNDTLSYPASPQVRSQAPGHPVLDMYEHHARQYQMYQAIMSGEVSSEASGRSSSHSSEASSDKQSDLESPGRWQRQYRGHEASQSESQVSSSSSSSHNTRHSSRRRRESFV